MAKKSKEKIKRSSSISSTSGSITSSSSLEEKIAYYGRLKEMAGKNGKWMKVWGGGYRLVFPPKKQNL